LLAVDGRIFNIFLGSAHDEDEKVDEKDEEEKG
jgi:hypothetical protein